jgi:hypothetical protein
LQGALDLFAFCFVVIFGNVLDFRTYTNPRGEPLEVVSDYDLNGIAVEERINMCQARGVCLEILRWWNTKYMAEGWSNVVGLITHHLLMSQVGALINYKGRAEKDNRGGAPGCTLSMLIRQIRNVLILVLPLGQPAGEALRRWRCARNDNSRGDSRELGFSIKDWEHLRIVERVPPLIFGKHYSADTSRPD